MGCAGSKDALPGRLLDYQGTSFRSNLVQHQLRWVADRLVGFAA